MNRIDSYCSSLFASIHPAFTIVQASIVAVAMIFGVPKFGVHHGTYQIPPSHG